MSLLLQEKLISILKNNNIDCNLERSVDISYPMTYSKRENKIRFNDYRLYDLLDKFPDMNVNNLAELALYHEIGHYLDHKHNPNNQKNRIEKEQSAWEYGLSVIPKELAESFNRMRKEFE